MCVFWVLSLGAIGPLLEGGLAVEGMLLVLSGVLSYFWLGRRFWAGMLLFCAGYGDARWQLAEGRHSYIRMLRRRSCHCEIRVRVGDLQRSTARSSYRSLEVLALKEGEEWRPCRGKALGVFPAESPTAYGEEAELEGAFLVEEQPGKRFSSYELTGHRRRFLVQDYTKLREASGWRRYYGRFLGLRGILAARLTEGIRDETCAGMYQAMVLGIREALDSRIREIFVTSATVHIFSISGLHVSLMAYCFGLLARYSGCPVRYRLALVLPVLGAYVLLSGAAPSALRAYWMVLALALSQYRYRYHSAENGLGVSGALLVLLNPLYLCHIGFLFSFTLVAVLLRGMEDTGRFSSVLCEKRFWAPQSWLGRLWWRQKASLASTVGASLVAWLASSGLMMRMSHLISYGTIFVNIALPPFAFLLVAGAIPKIAASFLMPGLSRFLGLPLQWLLEGLLALSKAGARPEFHVEGAEAGPGVLCAFFAILALALSGARPQWLRVLALAGLLAILFAFPFRREKPSPILVFYAGDGGPPCIAILSEQETVILECGGKSSARLMQEELVRLGRAGRLHLAVSSAASVDGAKVFFQEGKVRSIRLSAKTMSGRKAPVFARQCAAEGIATATGDGALFTGRLAFGNDGWRFTAPDGCCLRMELNNGGICSLNGEELAPSLLAGPHWLAGENE